MMSKTNEPKPRSGPKTWKPGQSGNPGGRSPRVGPNGETAAELARMHTAAAIETLASGLACPDWPTRVACANALLNRGWGTPKEHVTTEHTGPAIPIIQFVRQPDAPPE